jgi:hypothetical protein
MRVTCNYQFNGGSLCCFGRFKSCPASIPWEGFGDEIKIHAGDNIDKGRILNDMRTSELPLASWWPGIVVTDTQQSSLCGGSASFDFNSEKKGWHYGFNSNRFSDEHHSFVVFFFQEYGGKYTCLGSIESNKFKVFSQRRARKKGDAESGPIEKKRTVQMGVIDQKKRAKTVRDPPSASIDSFSEQLASVRQSNFEGKPQSPPVLSDYSPPPCSPPNDAIMPQAPPAFDLSGAESNFRWTQALEGIDKLPQNKGKKIRDKIKLAIEMCDHPEYKVRLSYSITKGVYKGNAAGKSQKLAVALLQVAMQQMKNNAPEQIPTALSSRPTAAQQLQAQHLQMKQQGLSQHQLQSLPSQQQQQQQQQQPQQPQQPQQGMYQQQMQKGMPPPLARFISDALTDSAGDSAFAGSAGPAYAGSVAPLAAPPGQWNGEVTPTSPDLVTSPEEENDLLGYLDDMFDGENTTGENPGGDGVFQPDGVKKEKTGDGDPRALRRADSAKSIGSVSSLGYGDGVTSLGSQQDLIGCLDTEIDCSDMDLSQALDSELDIRVAGMDCMDSNDELPFARQGSLKSTGSQGSLGDLLAMEQMDPMPLSAVVKEERPDADGETEAEWCPVPREKQVGDTVLLQAADRSEDDDDDYADGDDYTDDEGYTDSEDDAEVEEEKEESSVAVRRPASEPVGMYVSMQQQLEALDDQDAGEKVQKAAANVGSSSGSGGSVGGSASAAVGAYSAPPARAYRRSNSNSDSHVALAATASSGVANGSVSDGGGGGNEEPERERERSGSRGRGILQPVQQQLRSLAAHASYMPPHRALMIVVALLVLLMALSAAVGEHPPTVLLQICCGLFVARCIEDGSDPCTFTAYCALASRDWIQRASATAARDGMPAALRQCFSSSSSGGSMYAPVRSGGGSPTADGFGSEETSSPAEAGVVSERMRRRRVVGSTAGAMVVLMLLLAFSGSPPCAPGVPPEACPRDGPPPPLPALSFPPGPDKFRKGRWKATGRRGEEKPLLRGALPFMLVDPKTGQLTPSVAKQTQHGFARTQHPKPPPLPGCSQTEVKSDGIWCLKAGTKTWHLKQSFSKERYEHRGYNSGLPRHHGFVTKRGVSVPVVILVMLLVALFWSINNLCGGGEFELPEDEEVEMAPPTARSPSAPPMSSVPPAPMMDEPPMALPVGSGTTDEFSNI